MGTMIRKYLLIIAGIFIASVTKAQDIHFSQFYFSPLNFNPAAAGDMNASFRLVNNYKTQWSSVSANPYKTISVSADAPLMKDKLGAGLVFYSDKAGDSKMGINQISVPVDANVQINKENHIRLGLMPGFGQRSIDPTNVTWDSQYNGITFDKSLNNGEVIQPTSYNYFDLSAGMLWKYVKDENMQMQGALSAFHVNRPKQSYISNADPLKIRWVFNYSVKMKFGNSGNCVIPNVLVMKQGGAYEVTPGALIKFDVGLGPKISQVSNIYAGVFYRWKDAMIATLRVDYKNSLQVGMSYDINMSGLSPITRYKGGFEVALLYYLKGNRQVGNTPSFM